MTKPAVETNEAEQDSPQTEKVEEKKRERPSLESIIANIATALQSKYSAGDVANLRRMKPNDPSCAAFWRTIALYVAPVGMIPTEEALRIAAENKWAAILASMAKAAGMKGFHNPKNRLGKVLAEIDFAEARFIRLMRATDDALPDILRTTTMYIVSKGGSVDWTEMARLVLYQRGDFADLIRRKISRSYYTRLQQG